MQDWRDITKLQKHWIGNCNGVSFDFKILGEDSQNLDILTLWTSKPELMPNAKFVTVKSGSKLSQYKQESVNGVKKLVVSAENPLTSERIPIFVTDSVDYELFTDSYLGIPDGFEADKEFASSVNLPISDTQINYTSEEILRHRQTICDKAKQLKVGGYWTSAKLQDWLISRQRYWGTPIPIIHCEKCGSQPVSYKDLPIVLPDITEIPEKSAAHIFHSSEWLNTVCPKCQGPAKRETDTMDTFVDSSWYYLRYLDPQNDKEPFAKDKAMKIAPVDLYIGGKEHGSF